MAGNTPLHHFVKSELDDKESGIWAVFDREEALSMFAALGRTQGERKTNPLIKNVRSTARKFADYAFPSRVDAMMATRSQQRLPATSVLLRLLVLKDWHDRFFSRIIPERDSAWRD
jgi:hypothetical protein